MKKNLFYFLSVLGLFCCLFLFHNMYILAAYNIVFVSLYNILYKPIFGNLVLYSVSLWLITTLLLAVEIVVNISVWDIIIDHIGGRGFHCCKRIPHAAIKTQSRFSY